MQRKLPAYPIFVKDPYFSLWSPSDDPTASNVVFWQGDEKPVYGVVVARGEKGVRAYSFLGKAEGAEPMECREVKVSAFSTVYESECADFSLRAEFLSPLPPDDVRVFSGPVCYFTYELRPKKPLAFTVGLFLHERNVYHDRPAQGVRGDVMRCGKYETAYFGSDEQRVFAHTADMRAADWGYMYIAAPECFVTDGKGLARFLSGEAPAFGEEDGMLIGGADARPADGKAFSGTMAVAFDDVCSVFYYGQMLRGAWTSGGGTILDEISRALDGFEGVREQCRAFDEKLKALSAPYGEDYYSVLCASLRQAMAAHKAVYDGKGRLLFLSEECGSDGCIATLDVTYPSMPLFLLFAPELVKGMLYPILDFAEMPVWDYGFAPHDAGVYPYCNGQYYGVKNAAEGKYRRCVDYKKGNHGVLPHYYLYPAGSGLYDFTRQMPVEECGNILILASLLSDDKEFVGRYLPLLKKWADYLVQAGAVPENQLCTDDFAGHQDKNVNLAVKAAVALAGFAALFEENGGDGSAYRKEAERRAALIKAEGSPLPLSFGDKGTYGVKYNLFADKLLGTGLFSDIYEAEADCCLAHMNRYGTPLDVRKDYGKSDWLMWAAALTDDTDKRKTFMAALGRYLRETPDRIPFGDWYDTAAGEAQKYGGGLMFRNRSVQGGCFAPLLMDKKSCRGAFSVKKL